MTLKYSLGKKIVTIPLANVYKLRKESAGRLIVAILGFGTVATVNLVFFPINPIVWALSGALCILVYDAVTPYRKIKYPGKYITR